MMLSDPQRLLNWTVPEKTHAISREDAAFYALSVGCGHDPMDARQLRFVDPGARDFVALPSFVLVLGYPGFWLADPALGIDAKSVVHAEQTIEIVTTVPVEGVVTGRTRILDLIDGGPGKAAFLYSERNLFDGAGRRFAHLLQTHILRGAGGFGGRTARAAASQPAFGDTPHHVVHAETRPEQALLYRLNGDFNPLHSDPAVARKAGFPRPILHGMCTFGVLARAVMQSFCGDDPARLRVMSLRFTSPVFPGETITTEVLSDGSFRARVSERYCVVVDRGQARVAPQRHSVEVECYAV